MRKEQTPFFSLEQFPARIRPFLKLKNKLGTEEAYWFYTAPAPMPDELDRTTSYSHIYVSCNKMYFEPYFSPVISAADTALAFLCRWAFILLIYIAIADPGIGNFILLAVGIVFEAGPFLYFFALATRRFSRVIYSRSSQKVFIINEKGKEASFPFFNTPLCFGNLRLHLITGFKNQYWMFADVLGETAIKNLWRDVEGLMSFDEFDFKAAPGSLLEAHYNFVTHYMKYGLEALDVPRTSILAVKKMPELKKGVLMLPPASSFNYDEKRAARVPTRKPVVFKSKIEKVWGVLWRYLTFQFWPFLLKNLQLEANEFSPETWREIRGETK